MKQSSKIVELTRTEICDLKLAVTFAKHHSNDTKKWEALRLLLQKELNELDQEVKE